MRKSGLKSFSWGAFILGPLWGIGNDVYISFICLIPGLGIIANIYLGFKGKRIAWERSRFKNEAAFLYAQESWDKAGVFVIALILVFILIFLMPYLFVIIGGR